MKRNQSLMWTLCTLVIFVLVFGCAPTITTGKKIDSDALAKIKKGETTKSQASSILGPPNGTQVMGGRETWTYRYSSAKPKVFYFGGDWSAGQESQNVMIMFDEKGVVEEVISQSSKQ